MRPRRTPTMWLGKCSRKKPENAHFQWFPTQIQATSIMAVLDILSSHSPDEEYMGEKMEELWAEDEVLKAAFEQFMGTLSETESKRSAAFASCKESYLSHLDTVDNLMVMNDSRSGLEMELERKRHSNRE
ncbi:hypothetical protein M0R45_017891 [Rubus argutus]|uniref:Lipoxygenase domain-containing protein n=1 Tax=Rubus argutus TaxID=59490 RepID=A0AAW1XZR6_RUBAR